MVAGPPAGIRLAQPVHRTEVHDGSTREYAYAIQTAKGKFDGSAQEKDGKLYFAGTVKSEAEANEIWNAIKTIPDWRTDIVGDIKVVASPGWCRGSRQNLHGKGW